MIKPRLIIVLACVVQLTMYVATPAISFAQSKRIWATYYGGIGEEENNNVTTDASGNVYMTGYTNSPNAIAYNGFQNISGGGDDAFLVKFDSTGKRLWATYYGGTGEEYGWGVATDASGNIYLSGSTTSDSGIASGGFQDTYAGNLDAFLVKFNSAGKRLWATYYGGTGNEEGWNVTTDISGNVYMTGYTVSASGIASGGFQNTFGGGVDDVFLVKFDSTGKRLWATYYGGDGEDEAFSATTDKWKNIYLGGWTTSSYGVAAHGFQNSYGGGGIDGFLVKFDSAGHRLWGTYYGGPGDDAGCSVVTNVSGEIYLSGKTDSQSGIASGGFQNTIGNAAGLYDDFLIKFDSAGHRLWGTYYGGPGNEDLGSVATDVKGNIYLSGNTNSAIGIASGGFRDTLSGAINQFVVEFDSAGNRLCATYYGQANDENGHVAVDGFGHVYLAATTTSLTGIAYNGFQNTYGGGTYDTYLAAFSSCSNNVSGITGVAEENKWTVYPNPVSDVLFINAGESNKKIESIAVYDLLGRRALDKTVHQPAQSLLQVDVSGLAEGMYYLKIRTTEMNYLQPIIKN